MAPDDTSGSRPAPVVLRIKLRYDDVEAMVQRFAANVGKSGIFLPTKSLQPVGSEIKFELRLANDAPVVVGLGRVRATRPPDPDHPRASFGMAVELMRVTRDSRDLILRMLERRRQLGLPETGLPMPDDVDAARRAEVIESGVSEAGSGAMPAPVPPETAAPAQSLLTAPRRTGGPIAVAKDYTVKPLAPEPAKRQRPRISELIAKSAPGVAAAGPPELDDNVDVAGAIARARALASGDLDQELEALREEAAAPVEISIETASAELARQLGGSAVNKRDRSARWAPPPGVAEGERPPSPFGTGPVRLASEPARAGTGDGSAAGDGSDAGADVREGHDGNRAAASEARDGGVEIVSAATEARGHDAPTTGAPDVAAIRADAGAARGAAIHDEAVAVRADAARGAAIHDDAGAAGAARGAAIHDEAGTAAVRDEAPAEAGAPHVELGGAVARDVSAEPAGRADERDDRADALTARDAPVPPASSTANAKPADAGPSAALATPARRRPARAQTPDTLDRVLDSALAERRSSRDLEDEAADARAVAARSSVGATPRDAKPADASRPQVLRATTADIAEALSAIDDISEKVSRAASPVKLETTPGTGGSVAPDDEESDVTPPVDDPPVPLHADDAIHALSELDMEDVEHTNIGDAPDPDAFERHAHATQPAAHHELADRLDRDLADAEAEADADLASAIDAESGPHEPIASYDSAEDVDEFQIEEVSDFEIIAEADADDADLLLADGERDASQDNAPAHRPSSEFDVAAIVPNAADYATQRSDAEYAAPTPDPELAAPDRPSMLDFAARLDLGDDEVSERHAEMPQVRGYTSSAYDDRVDEEPSERDEPLRFEQPSDRFPYNPGSHSYTFANEIPADDFDEPHAGFGQPRYESVTEPPAPASDDFDEPHAAFGQPRYESVAEPAVPASDDFDEPHAGFGQPRYESVAEPPAPTRAPSDFDLESALQALDVDLDDLSLPHRRPLTPSPAASAGVPGRVGASPSGRVRDPASGSPTSGRVKQPTPASGRLREPTPGAMREVPPEPVLLAGRTREPTPGRPFEPASGAREPTPSRPFDPATGVPPGRVHQPTPASGRVYTAPSQRAAQATPQPQPTPARTQQPTPGPNPVGDVTGTGSGRIHRRASTEDGILIDFDDDDEG